MKYPAQIVFFLVLLAVGLGVYRDYGISSDEPTSRINGAVTLKYVAERFAPSLLPAAASGLDPLNEYLDRDYGVAFEAPAVLLEVMLGIRDKKNVFMFRHLLTFLVALAGIYAVKRMRTGASRIGESACSRHYFWFSHRASLQNRSTIQKTPSSWLFLRSP